MVRMDQTDMEPSVLNLQPEHPFYRPLWVRILLVGITAVWAAVEFYNKAPFWGVIFGGVSVYLAYELLWRYDKHRDKAGS